MWTVQTVPWQAMMLPQASWEACLPRTACGHAGWSRCPAAVPTPLPAPDPFSRFHFMSARSGLRCRNEASHLLPGVRPSFPRCRRPWRARMPRLFRRLCLPTLVVRSTWPWLWVLSLTKPEIWWMPPLFPVLLLSMWETRASSLACRASQHRLRKFGLRCWLRKDLLWSTFLTGSGTNWSRRKANSGTCTTRSSDDWTRLDPSSGVATRP